MILSIFFSLYLITLIFLYIYTHIYIYSECTWSCQYKWLMLNTITPTNKYINVLFYVASPYFMFVKSVSPSLWPSHLALAPQVQLSLVLKPHEQASEAAGATFSTVALSQLHFNAGRAPQEQVDFWAHTHSEAEQTIFCSFCLFVCLFVCIYL